MALLLTWTDRGPSRKPEHHVTRKASDQGPILRLLDQPESVGRYSEALVLTTRAAREPSQALVAGMAERIPQVALQTLELEDPSDYAALFAALAPVLKRLPKDLGTSDAQVDVLLSAGTPQAQTLWVILVQARLLKARMLQVIPADFVPHPHPKAVREVRLDIEGFPEIRALKEEVAHLRAKARLAAGSIVGESANIHALMQRAARVAPTTVPVLVLGETGTGKELVARAIHEASRRAAGPFIAENCGTFAEGVLASELFGHEKGAFTGATGRRRGLFEMANGGTLFLDEVGELPLKVQVNLLRVLEDGTLRRVGAEDAVKVDVRVIAATHRDLRSMVREGTFREDLFYRLCGATLEIPPLRERLDDLERLVRHFLEEIGALHLTPTRDAWRALQRYTWPGNVRELRAEVLRWTVFCDHWVEVQDLSPAIQASLHNAISASPYIHQTSGDFGGASMRQIPQVPQPSLLPAQSLAEVLQEAEDREIRRALEETGGNLAQAARRLEIDRNTLKRKMALYGIDRPSGAGGEG